MLHSRAILTAFALTLPLVSAEAQTPRRPQPPADRTPPVSATELLDARRVLELTPRQVARLDSIERAQFAQRRALSQQMQKQRDSVCANRRPCVLSDEDRTKFRELMSSGRSGPQALWRSDSSGRALAMSLLDSTQRGRVQGWRMGQRRARMEQGFGPQGFDRRGTRGFQRGQRFGAPLGPGGPGQFGPRFRQRDGMGPAFVPRGRFGPPGGDVDPRFNRRRGMMGPGPGDDATGFGPMNGRRGPRPPRPPEDATARAAAPDTLFERQP